METFFTDFRFISYYFWDFFLFSFFYVRALHAPVIISSCSIIFISSRRRRRFISKCLRGLLSPGGEYRTTSSLSPEPRPADDGWYVTENVCNSQTVDAFVKFFDQKLERTASITSWLCDFKHMVLVYRSKTTNMSLSKNISAKHVFFGFLV